MTEQERQLIEQAKREASVSLIASLAKAMGAKVQYYNPEAGQFTLVMDPRALEFFGIKSVVEALGDVQ